MRYLMAKAQAALILWLAGSTVVHAGDTCFNDPAVKKLIAESHELDACFTAKENNCPLARMTPDELTELNLYRLAPVDRTEHPLLDHATGAVSVKLREGGFYAGSAQKVSRCHIVASAHVVYADTIDPARPPIVRFHHGQTCDPEMLFRHTVDATVRFSLVDESTVSCRFGRKHGKYCELPEFPVEEDVVILRLKQHDPRSTDYFRLSTAAPIDYMVRRDDVACWGYPEHNAELATKIRRSLSDMVLWHQESVQMLGLNGFLHSTAVAHGGMSGGGCALRSKPRELVGVLTASPVAAEIPVAVLTRAAVDTGRASKLTSFHVLASRFKAATGKDIDSLDKECDP